MGKRRKAREVALQILYQVELNPNDLKVILSDFWKDNPSENEIIDFAEALIKGTLEKGTQIDQIIQDAVKNWKLDRLSVIDRNIIRIGTFEMLYLQDYFKDQDTVPAAVTINEAVEIAKKFSTPDSGKFVNGILDQIRKICGKERS